MQRFPLCTLLALFTATACDANVDAEHRGEPLISLRGQVVHSGTSGGAPSYTSEDVKVALVWENFATSPDTYVVDNEVSIEGDFPAKFNLDLYTPPKDEVMMDQGDGLKVATASIFAVKADADLTTFDVDDLVGTVENHILLYVEGDVAPGSDLADALGGPIPAGFHLLEVTLPLEGAYEACLEEKKDQLDISECDQYHFATLSLAPPDAFLTLTLGSTDTPNYY